MKINCTVNGEQVEADVEARLLLSDFLRHQLRLTGTHVGCEVGVCGACTVIVDGRPARSCLMFAAQADACDIRTVESLTDQGKLNKLQQAFGDKHALQCGFCTPGILMTLEAALINAHWPANETEARHLLGGNICRCTGYQNIVEAIVEYTPD